MLTPDYVRQADPRRICVIKPSAMGDIVQSLPLLPILRRCFPKAHLAWVVKRELADLLVDHPCLDQVITYDRHGSWRSGWQLVRRLRSAQFDMVIDLQGLLRTAIMTVATGAPIRIGLESAREGSRWACNGILPRTGRDFAAHERYWRLAEWLGEGGRPRETWIHVQPQDLRWAQSRIPYGPGPVVAIHCGAQWETKCWPPAKFGEIARRLLQQLEARVVLVGSEGERNRSRQLIATLPDSHGIIDLVGQTSLKRLTAVLRQADLMISNDSGPMHVAAGVGVPVVGIFTCTRPDRSGPPGPQHQLVSTRVACAGSYRKQCPHPASFHMQCMDELDVERVWQAVVRASLGRSAAHAPHTHPVRLSPSTG